MFFVSQIGNVKANTRCKVRSSWNLKVSILFFRCTLLGQPWWVKHILSTVKCIHRLNLRFCGRYLRFTMIIYVYIYIYIYTTIRIRSIIYIYTHCYHKRPEISMVLFFLIVQNAYIFSFLRGSRFVLGFSSGDLNSLCGFWNFWNPKI